MPNSLLRAVCAVASTLPSRTESDPFLSLAAAWANSGASLWQCPHHGASAWSPSVTHREPSTCGGVPGPQGGAQWVAKDMSHEPGTLQHTSTLFCVPAPYPMPLPCGPASHRVPLHQTLCLHVVTLRSHAPAPLTHTHSPVVPMPLPYTSAPALHSRLCPVPLPVPSPCPHPGHLQNSTSSRLNSLKARAKLCS